MRTPPLLADFTHARSCKPFCEKFLTLPTIVISLCGQGISCPSFLCLADGVAFYHLILGRKKAGDLFQISCSVCRCVGGGYLVVKVRGKLTQCEADKLEFIALFTNANA